jgi:hypothetical protein
MAWVNIASLAKRQTIGAAYNTNGWYLEVNTNGTVTWGIFGPGNSHVVRHSITSTNIVTAGEWYHVAGVCDEDKGEYRVYVNGVEEKSDKSDFIQTPSNTQFQVGKTNPNSWDPTGGETNYLTGFVDELALWNVAIDGFDFQTYYNRTK